MGFLVLWAMEKARNNLQLKKIGLFILGAAIPLLMYVIFFLAPYWDKLSPFLLSITGKSAMLSLPYDIVYLSYNTFFGLIPVIFLLIPIICYLAYLLTKISYDPDGCLKITKYILGMDYLEILVISWIVGGVTMLLFTDFDTRRFLVFFIPLTILFAKVLVDKCQFQLNKIICNLVDILTHQRVWIKILVSFIMVFPIYVAFIIFFRYGLSMGGSTYILLSLLGTFLVWVFLISPYRETGKKIRHLKALIILISLSGWFILPFINLLNLNSSLLSVYMNLTLSPMYRVGIAFLVMLIIIFLFIWNQKLFKVTGRFARNLLIIYLLVNVLIIGLQFATPSFTVMESSQSLHDYAEDGDVVIGMWSHELSFENRIFPLWYIPNDDQYKTINQNLTGYNPRYLLTADEYVTLEDDSIMIYPSVGEFRKVKFIKKIYLCPYPYTNQYRVILNLYEIQEE